MNRRFAAWLVAAAALAARGARAQTEPPAAEAETVSADEEPNYELDSALSGTWYSLSYPPGVPPTSGNQETLSLNVIAFQTPLRDDDSPYSLQPFMQRENTFTLSLVAGRFDTANQFGGVDRTEWYSGLGVAVDAYLKRWFAVFARASYEYFELHDVDVSQVIHSFGAEAGVGFRHRETRIDLSVVEGGSRTSGAFGSWRRSLTLSAFTVIKRRLSIAAAGNLLSGGQEGSFQVELFPTKATGVYAGASVGRYEPYSDPIVVTRYGGVAGFTGWLDATTALVGEYSLTSETEPPTQITNGYHQLSHTFSLQVFFRFQ
jgi:hypothetical protein